jgi:hypothetical protein
MGEERREVGQNLWKKNESDQKILKSIWIDSVFYGERDSGV